MPIVNMQPPAAIPQHARNAFARPLIAATVFTWVSELLLLLFYGVYLSDEGDLLYKVIWTLGFCGFGMGLTLGALIDIFFVGRAQGRVAIWGTSLLTFLLLGVGCNTLCMFLDQHFRYFGGAENPLLHFLPSMIGSVIGGYGLGWFLFAPKRTPETPAEN